jgi:hypothetical protein
MNNLPYSTLFSGLIGVIVGGLITAYLGYAKTRAMLKWETKYNAYNAILEYDKGFPINSLDVKKQIRFAKRLKALSENKEIEEIADKMIDGKFEDLADKERFIDEKFIPAIEKDLNDTMKPFKWSFWK